MKAKSATRALARLLKEPFWSISVLSVSMKVPGPEI